MWIGIIILAYAIGVFLLIRFFRAVHHWDEEIDAMESRSGRKGNAAHCKPAM